MAVGHPSTLTVPGFHPGMGAPYLVSCDVAFIPCFGALNWENDRTPDDRCS